METFNCCYGRQVQLAETFSCWAACCTYYLSYIMGARGITHGGIFYMHKIGKQKRSGTVCLHHIVQIIIHLHAFTLFICLPECVSTIRNLFLFITNPQALCAAVPNLIRYKGSNVITFNRLLSRLFKILCKLKPCSTIAV